MVETDIVILNWNGLHFLKQFLPVLIKHTPEDQARIIIADNGSTDSSLEWLEGNYKSKIDTIALGENHGFAGGYNLALEHSSSKYAVLLNSDVEVTEGWLSPLLEAIRQDNVAAVMPKIKSQLHRNSFEYAGASGGFIDRWGFPFCRGRILAKLEEDHGQYDDQKEIFWATGACMMIKTEVFRNFGGFDAHFFAHMEEIDLCWRIKAGGFSILVVPGSTVYHVGGGTLPSGNQRKIFLNVRNSLLTLYKNLPRKNLVSILLVRMVLDGLAAFKFLFEGSPASFRAVMRAHLSFYRDKKLYRLNRRNNKGLIPPGEIRGFYRRSIVLDYYFRGRRVFAKINLKKIK